jgi:serine/threonine protein kinase
MKTSDFALKRIEVDGENYDSIMQEVAALRRRIHRNIIPLLASYTQLAIESSFETKSINILFPYAEMTMEKWLYLHSPPALIACQSPSEQRRYLYTAMYDLVSALASLHREVDGLVTSHHDLKPKNILVLGNKLMLADLGMSKLIHIHRTGGSEVDGANGIGTSTYHPPEYYREDDWERDRKMAFGRAFDMWAMGCIMIQVAILIAWGWESRNVEKFRRDRGNFILKEINNGDTHKSRIDDSFVKSIPVVDALLTRLQESGRTILQGFLAVIIQMLHKNPLERIYSWEAELDLYQLLHPDESTEERLKKEASAVQAPPPGKDINGIDTPIHRAARRGNIIRAISMLGAGWPVELKDGTMRTPIELAEQNGHFLLKDILLRATTVRQDGWRSVLKDGIPTPVIHTRDYRGFRIIQDTPWQGSDTSHYQGRGKDPHSSPSNLELQQEPLNSHTEQNVKSTDLHSVAKMKGVESLCTLLKSISSDEELLQGDEFGLTPLHHASKNSVAHINLILKAAKDPKQLLLAKDIRGRTPLHMAMGGNQLVAADTMLRYFAERRQALLVEDNEGITPLKMALESGGTDWEKIFEIID